MKKSGITSPSERRSPCREPAENSAHSLKLTFVSNFLKVIIPHVQITSSGVQSTLSALESI